MSTRKFCFVFELQSARTSIHLGRYIISRALEGLIEFNNGRYYFNHRAGSKKQCPLQTRIRYRKTQINFITMFCTSEEQSPQCFGWWSTQQIVSDSKIKTNYYSVPTCYFCRWMFKYQTWVNWPCNCLRENLVVLLGITARHMNPTVSPQVESRFCIKQLLFEVTRSKLDCRHIWYKEAKHVCKRECNAFNSFSMPQTLRVFGQTCCICLLANLHNL